VKSSPSWAPFRFISLSVNMLKYQVICVSSLLFLFPSSSRILVFLLLFIRVFLPFTSLEHSFTLSSLLTQLGVVTFVSASLLITVHLGLWILKLALFWMGNYINCITPFSPWVIAIQFSGLAVVACPSFPLVDILMISLTNNQWGFGKASSNITNAETRIGSVIKGESDSFYFSPSQSTSSPEIVKTQGMSGGRPSRIKYCLLSICS
jgi:hypothetical protein